jgi:hypothetical protein
MPVHDTLDSLRTAIPDSNHVSATDNSQRSQPKRCFVCEKEGCWSTKHTEEEPEESRKKYRAQFGRTFDEYANQYITEYEGTEEDAGFDDHLLTLQFLPSNELHLLVLVALPQRQASPAPGAGPAKDAELNIHDMGQLPRMASVLSQLDGATDDAEPLKDADFDDMFMAASASNSMRGCNVFTSQANSSLSKGMVDRKSSTPQTNTNLSKGPSHWTHNSSSQTNPNPSNRMNSTVKVAKVAGLQI